MRRRENARYEPELIGSVWAIKVTTTWKNLDGDWDGEFDHILYGLTEATARLVCDEMNGRAQPQAEAA